MFVKSSTFNEENHKELVEFYGDDIGNFDLVKAEVLLWNRYLDKSNIQLKNTINILNAIQIYSLTFLSSCKY